MLETILLSFGGQLIGKLVAKKFGADFGDLAAETIGKLGEAFGVPDAVDNQEALGKAIEAAPAAKAREAIGRIEAEAAEAILARAELQQAENAELALVNEQLRDQAKGPWFGWAWRPAGMWGLGFLWFWSIPGLHLVNAIMKWQIPPTDMPTLLSLTALYCSLYMGGHTIKDFVAKKWGVGK